MPNVGTPVAADRPASQDSPSWLLLLDYMQKRDDKLDQLLSEQRAADREAIAALTQAVADLKRTLEAERRPRMVALLDGLYVRRQKVQWLMWTLAVVIVIVYAGIQIIPWERLGAARRELSPVEMHPTGAGGVVPSETLHITDPGQVQRLEYQIDPRWNR